MHVLLWIKILWSRLRWFGYYFHEWRSHGRRNSLANHITSDQIIVINSNECIILCLTQYFMSWAHSSAKNNHRSLISSLSLRKVFYDLALWRHHIWSVTSRERQLLALSRLLPRPAVNIAVNEKSISNDLDITIHVIASLWRHQQSLVTSSAERKPSEWNMGTMWKDRHFYRHLWIRYVV